MKKYVKVILNNKRKVSAPTWNENFEKLGRSYLVADIQDYFEYILKKHETVTDNPPVRINVNKIENRITFRIIMPERMKLLRSTANKITKDKHG